MNAYSIVAIALIALGIVMLAFGQFTFTKETHEAQLGPLELSVQDRDTVSIPPWIGAFSVIAGVGLLFVGVRAKTTIGH
ncbi:MAG: hypothetical protein IT366_01660 [Candidatus Hydrogenedentes bacterium]|nr:hypothetical protein [Candidatus Hydrogenedentota bacterium]